MKRGLAILCVATALVAFVAAPAQAKQPDTPEAAANALKQQLQLAATGQYGKLYGQMHPAEKAIMPQAVYITCASKNSSGITLENVEVVGTHKEPVVIPGTNVTALSTAITVKLTAKRGLVEQSQTTTLHEFYVKGRWLYTATKVYSSAQDC
jgi:DMSO/TMAO reductase YedYZ molybdopterin-dependent catalytic subunit